ncbi:MAG TPA: ABC transporter ATP-binding protein [Clostridiaceae bacterium]|nr:ABC transporter ATP-binding protein [Clostridiaceae bacterium]
MALLEVKNLTLRFGGLIAVNDVSFSVEDKSITGLIGQNGAGKTTIFNLLTHVYQPNEGTVILDGEVMKGKKPHQAVARGLTRTFQNIRLFRNMPVIDNVKVGFVYQGQYSVPSGVFRLPPYWREEKEMQEKAMELLQVFDLDRYASHYAGNLPYGQQRQLEICRALATNPRVLLLDEPAAGMNPSETESLMERIDKVRERFAIAILLIEHDMKLVMGICDKVVVLNYGCVIAEGCPEKIRSDEEVINAYLGCEV